jgi:hypothetical protein
LAVAGEVPLAALCFWIAFDAERVGRHTAHYWRRRWSRLSHSTPR